MGVAPSTKTRWVFFHKKRDFPDRWRSLSDSCLMLSGANLAAGRMLNGKSRMELYPWCIFQEIILESCHSNYLSIRVLPVHLMKHCHSDFSNTNETSSELWWLQDETQNVSAALLDSAWFATVFSRYCHDRGIIHRDIKPENILFVSTDSEAPAKLIDFGASPQNLVRESDGIGIN